MIINIKGCPYNIKSVEGIEGFPNADGLCKKVDKEILFIKNNNELDTAECIIHELTHAFLYECGAVEESCDESLVSWIARNFFCILDSFKKVYSKFCKSKKEQEFFKEVILGGVK